MASKKVSDAVLAICNRGCTDIPLETTAREHAAVCPINNRFLCKFCARRFSQASMVEKHTVSNHDWSAKEGTICFVGDFRSPAMILMAPNAVSGLKTKAADGRTEQTSVRSEIIDFLEDDDGHFLDQSCVQPGVTRERSISPFLREKTRTQMAAYRADDNVENRMLKEQVTFLSSQVTELNQTVKFQEKLINKLLTYLPDSAQE